jgi:hypothetical protein
MFTAEGPRCSLPYLAGDFSSCSDMEQQILMQATWQTTEGYSVLMQGVFCQCYMIDRCCIKSSIMYLDFSSNGFDRVGAAGVLQRLEYRIRFLVVQ